MMEAGGQYYHKLLLIKSMFPHHDIVEHRLNTLMEESLGAEKHNAKDYGAAIRKMLLS